MKRKNKNKIFIVMIPMLYSILSLICIFVLGKPVITMCKETIYAMVKQNTPNDITSVKYEDLKHSDEEHVNETKPELGSSYAMLVCDTIGLKAEVYYGDSTAEFKNGLGQYTNGVYPWIEGTMLIGGHDTTYFSTLKDMKKDDIVLLRTEQKEYKYQFERIEIVQAESMNDEILLSEDKLILYTCYPFDEISKDRTERYLVYCKRLYE